jgi:hypothetical protein
MLFSGGLRVEGEDTTADRLRCIFIDDVAGRLDDTPVVDDLALTGFEVTGLAGSRRLLPTLELLLLLMTIPLLPE